ncbi:large conductance mechanosensitive channel protein MscL [Polymorphobacter fuscus]|uniref:Large-conductance mechanosensitive channel n=1 Tax=Sandarakinorhabdus fusca TaxID=1439888 RepID=A0A7C9KYN6_9SPHN|nr:large conductance mechanosensitive channel protein MscL [Polymorphobacter fuscus]KAB7647877.1 large conductance mechanosensitive channel protein MscL [Polymorphobacter fuscus]MQT17188.1 large conductance mechanosensitive channel protein MscL [Polymorphobacter fuscus]NJC08818.1 large conductance mechanosensitive channel [Polymorphobacter fuscus]
MIQEFKTFIARGNVLDLAVAVVIGAAFGKIVSSLTDDIIMPVIGAITGGVDFSSYFITLGSIPATYAGSPNDYAALKAAGVPMIGFGSFVTAVINFLIIAFVIFLIVRAANRVIRPAEAPAPAGPTPTEALLAEIRDELRAGRP